MKRIKVNNIKIIYEEESNAIKEFIEILKNNYYLFEDYLEGKTISFVKTDREDMIYLENPLTYADDAIKEYTCNEHAFHRFEKIPLESLYITFLARKLHVDRNKSFINIDTNVSNERYDMSFYYIVGYHYFKEQRNVDDYIEFIKYRKEKKDILKWLQNKVRYNVSNMLLEKVIEYFDDYFYNNIEIITKLVKSMFNNDNYINEEIVLQEIDSLERDYLFKKFLLFIKAPREWFLIYEELKKDNRMFIKAPREWFLIYEELKKDNRIIYIDMGEKIDKSQCFKEGGLLKILIDNKGTIISFIDLVHEFMHYVSWKDTSTISNYATIELPSIFFEKLSSIFLVENGYDKNIIKAVYKEREDYNIMTSRCIIYIFEVINDFIKNGCIAKDKEIMEIQKYINLIKEDKKALKDVTNMYNKIGLKFDASCIVNNKYDKVIKDIITKGPFMILGYQYILGTIISDKILNKHDNDMIEKMIMVTNNLKEYGLEDVLKLFNISLEKCTQKRLIK